MYEGLYIFCINNMTILVLIHGREELVESIVIKDQIESTYSHFQVDYHHLPSFSVEKLPSHLADLSLRVASASVGTLGSVFSLWLVREK